MNFLGRSPSSGIQVNPRGITVKQPDRNKEIVYEAPWVQVDRIVAYKKDCLTVDQIRFEFQLCDGRTLIVTEDMQGWKELITELPNWLAGFPAESEWFPRIAQPPFATNLCVLYERTTRP